MIREVKETTIKLTMLNIQPNDYDDVSTEDDEEPKQEAMNI